MQFQADVLGVPVNVPDVAETTALGAAYLAGIATGLGRRIRSARCGVRPLFMEPGMPESERDALIGRWREAVTRAPRRAAP